MKVAYEIEGQFLVPGQMLKFGFEYLFQMFDKYSEKIEQFPLLAYIMYVVV